MPLPDRTVTIVNPVIVAAVVITSLSAVCLGRLLAHVLIKGIETAVASVLAARPRHATATGRHRAPVRLIPTGTARTTSSPLSAEPGYPAVLVA